MIWITMDYILYIYLTTLIHVFSVVSYTQYITNQILLIEIFQRKMFS